VSGIVLHSYDASPFTQRVLRMLGLKNLEWRWVETPMMPPKDDLVALTGGYRGTPVLQLGSDIYIDSTLIALELERRHPEPSLFPARDTGASLELVAWHDAFFRAGLKIILAMSAHSWPEPFRKDRESLFADIDFDAAGLDLGCSRAQYRAHASLIDRQLADGRPYLAGERAGFVDAFAYPLLWFMRGALPAVADELLDGCRNIPAWESRIAALGEGRRTRIEASAAFDEALSSKVREPPAVDPQDAQGLREGMRVRIEPMDTRRGTVEGEVWVAQPNEIAIRRRHALTGAVTVHFPRIGYRVTPL
jgi:glutathione S-transferase